MWLFGPRKMSYGEFDSHRMQTLVGFVKEDLAKAPAMCAKLFGPFTTEAQADTALEEFVKRIVTCEGAVLCIALNSIGFRDRSGTSNTAVVARMGDTLLVLGIDNEICLLRDDPPPQLRSKSVRYSTNIEDLSSRFIDELEDWRPKDCSSLDARTRSEAISWAHALFSRRLQAWAKFLKSTVVT